MKVDFSKIKLIYDKEISKNCRNKRKVFSYEKNKIANTCCIYNILSNNIYYPSRYNIFIIKEPKYRIVMSLNIIDKVINHYLARYVLIPKLDKYLDRRIVATREGYGLDFGIKLVKEYIEKNKKYDDFYVLKIDIKKYFYNIDHEVLKGLLKDKLEKQEFELIERVIDSTDSSYINDCIDKESMKMITKRSYDKEKILDLPRYKKGKGLGLGAMTSQFLSIFFLNELDHYIVHDLHLKYMVHYMDDIVIIHHDKEYLSSCLEKIKVILKNKYKLDVNAKKTNIVSIHEGFSFLGYRFFLDGKKTILKIKGDTIKKVKRRIKELNYLYKNDKVDFEKVFCSINTYLYSFKYASNIKIIKIIDNYLEGL